jgi:predicted MFS family arabinose efflux permease
VNLFADATYEGGASINGPFLANLGASAMLVSVVAGVGEFLGYSLRSVSGWIADRTGRYWAITFAGYAVNLLAVPAMALATTWQAAAALMLAERIGRALRKPTVEAMLSYSTGKHGRGWVYAVNTALDEIGSTLGPLLMTLVLLRDGSYSTGYSLLLVPSLLALASLTIARVFFPVPARLEEGGRPTATAHGFGRSYRLYMLAGAFFAAGLMSFELIAYHLGRTGAVSPDLVPALLGLATVAGIAGSLVLGKLYDRRGISVVVAAVCAASLFSPLVFLAGRTAILVGLALWGIGYAIQDTMLKALIASVLPEGRRNLAFGLFYLGYGTGWLAGGVITGLLYERSHPSMVAFAMLAQLVSAPLFWMAARADAKRRD